MDIKQLLSPDYKINIEQMHNLHHYISKPIVIFSASSGGKAITDYLKDTYNKYPIAFADNSKEKQGTLFEGIPIYSFDEIRHKYDFSEITVINASDSFRNEIYIQLKTAGLPDDSYMDIQFLAAFDENFLQHKNFITQNTQSMLLDYVSDVWTKSSQFHNLGKRAVDNIRYDDYLMQNAAKLEAVYDILADSKSKDIYEKYIHGAGNSHINTKYKYTILDSVRDGNYYLGGDIIKLDENEVFVMAGAYGGIDSIKFAEQTKGKYSHIVTFEPDKENFLKAKENLESYGLQRYHIFNEALYSKDCTLYFAADGDMGSKIENTGTIEVKAVTLDGCMERLGIWPSYIRLDVEGAEAEALLGTKKIIENHQPKLQISIYHKKEDIFELPLLIKKLNPKYDIYIRAHADLLCSMVCYAI